MADSLSEWRAKAAERDAARDVRPVERGFTPQQNEELNSWALQHRDQEFEHRIKPEIDGVIEPQPKCSTNCARRYASWNFS